MNTPGNDVYISTSPINPSDLRKAAQIHQEVLGYTFNSKLGLDHLIALYQSMVEYPECYVGIAYDSQEPVGIVSGALSLSATKKMLIKSLGFRSLIQLPLKFLSDIELVKLLWNSKEVDEPVYFEQVPVDAILTTIAVGKEQQGKGIGKKLVRGLENFFSSRQVTLYRLDTLSENYQAREFYKKMGFREAEVRHGNVIFVKKVDQ